LPYPSQAQNSTSFTLNFTRADPFCEGCLPADSQRHSGVLWRLPLKCENGTPRGDAAEEEKTPRLWRMIAEELAREKDLEKSRAFLRS
jgi:hypothetical protein